MDCHLSKNQRQSLNPDCRGAKVNGLREVWQWGEETPVPGGYFKETVGQCRQLEQENGLLCPVWKNTLLLASGGSQSAPGSPQINMENFLPFEHHVCLDDAMLPTVMIMG